MSRRVIGIAVAVLVTALSGAAIARGGGGHGGGGHGGGPGGGGGRGPGVWRAGVWGGGGSRVGHGGGHGFGRAHFGGGGQHFGGYRGGFSRHSVGRAHFGGSRFSARHQNFGQIRNAAIAPGHGRNAMNLLSRPGALRNGKLLGNPAARAQIAATAALAGWHGGAVGNGWWRHGNGGYGWVGPLFWPFAYNDLYDYAIWDDGFGFWGYGYPDIYAGIFPPYGYDDLAGYFPQRRWDRRRGRPVA